MGTNKYSIKLKRGIDDLQSIYAFIGNSQGDESKSNEISDYVASKGWMSYIFTDINISSQEDIYAESERRKKVNEDYVKKLKEEGRYEEEYEISIELVYNPLYDAPSKPEKGLSNARIMFLDLNKPTDK